VFDFNSVHFGEIGAIAGLLADFSDASHFDDRRFLLAICKCSGSLTISVGAGESLAILVKQNHLPATVFVACLCLRSFAFSFLEY
jgi:hypothetical protein